MVQVWDDVGLVQGGSHGGIEEWSNPWGFRALHLQRCCIAQPSCLWDPSKVTGQDASTPVPPSLGKQASERNQLKSALVYGKKCLIRTFSGL